MINHNTYQIFARMWRDWNSHTLMGMENSKSFLKSLAVFSKLNTHLPYNAAIPHLGIYPREMKHVHNVHSSFISNSPKSENTRILMMRWIDKVWYVSVQFSSVAHSCQTLYDHTRPPCPSPTPRVYSNSCPPSRWCHPVI